MSERVEREQGPVVWWREAWGIFGDGFWPVCVVGYVVFGVTQVSLLARSGARTGTLPQPIPGLAQARGFLLVPVEVAAGLTAAGFVFVLIAVWRAWRRRVGAG